MPCFVRAFMLLAPLKNLLADMVKDDLLVRVTV